ncbi:MAG: class I SAM-dependent methyltransferase [Clostridia bacterium]|nr:class I SAM-dependent methyltransferase [Clostridia bacterium]
MDCVQALADLRVSARQRNIPIIREQSARLLESIVKQCKPNRILEIGTAYGYSTSLMLLASPNARINTIDISDSSQCIAKQSLDRYGLTDRANFICGDSQSIVPMLTGQYDLIFMDGAKSQYISLLPYLLDLLCVGGTLVCDNVNYMGLPQIVDSLPNNHKHITIARNMANFIKTIKADVRLLTDIYQVEDGLSVSKKLTD